MIIYLYVKTHNITGLKYLGKTINKDPYKYPGSGTYWKLHLKVWGDNCKTEILKECTSKEEIAELGIYYSELWNIVESDDWANLIAENGDGGGPKHTKESIEKTLATKKANGTLNTTSSESIEKQLATKKANGTLKSNTPESIEKQLTTKKLNSTMNINTPETIEKMLATRKANGTMKTNTLESIAKMVATRRANGSYKQSPDTIKKCAP